MSDTTSQEFDYDALFEWIEQSGWRRGSSPVSGLGKSHSWYRQHPDVVPNCCCNSERPGVQIERTACDHRQYDRQYGVSFEVELVAEPDDGVWVCLTCYSLSAEQLREKLDAQVEKLIRAWKAVQAPADQPEPEKHKTPGCEYLATYAT